jgi:UDP-galactopyranose mutase
MKKKEIVQKNKINSSNLIHHGNNDDFYEFKSGLELFWRCRNSEEKKLSSVQYFFASDIFFH